MVPLFATLLIVLLQMARAVSRAPSLRHFDSDEIDGHNEWLAQRTAVSLPRIDPAARWELDASHLDVVVDVMGPGSVAGDLDVVVHSTEQAVLSDVNRLCLAEHFEFCGIVDDQALPWLAALAPGARLLTLDARPGEHEGYVEVRPHRAADEERQLQICPRCGQLVTSEGGARRQELLDDPAILRLNGDSVPRKRGTKACRSEWRVGRPLAIGRDSHADVGDLRAVGFHVPQSSSLRQVRTDGRVPPPCTKAAVSRDRSGGEVVHRTSDMSGFQILNGEGVRSLRAPRSRAPRWFARDPTSPNPLELPRSTAPMCASLAPDRSRPPRRGRSS